MPPLINIVIEQLILGSAVMQLLTIIRSMFIRFVVEESSFEYRYWASRLKHGRVSIADKPLLRTHRSGAELILSEDTIFISNRLPRYQDLILDLTKFVYTPDDPKLLSDFEVTEWKEELKKHNSRETMVSFSQKTGEPFHVVRRLLVEQLTSDKNYGVAAYVCVIVLYFVWSYLIGKLLWFL